MLDQDTPFAKAVAKRDARAAIRIATQDPSVTELKLPSCYDYETALHAAVRIKSAKLAEILLDHGMDVDVLDGGRLLVVHQLALQVAPQADIVERYHGEFLRQWDELGMSWDLFTTTGTPNHARVTIR